MLNKTHRKEAKEYFDRLKSIRERAETEYELARVERMLRNLPSDKFVFKPPPPPAYHLFIRKRFSYIILLLIGQNEMSKLIRDALLNRIDWDNTGEKPAAAHHSRANM